MNHQPQISCPIKAHSPFGIIGLCLSPHCQAESPVCKSCITELHYQHVNDIKYLSDLEKCKPKQSPYAQIQAAFRSLRSRVLEHLDALQKKLENYTLPLIELQRKAFKEADQINKLGLLLKHGPLELLGNIFEEALEQTTEAVIGGLNASFGEFIGFEKGHYLKEYEEQRERGLVLFKQGKNEEAIAVIDECLGQKKNDFELLELKGCAHYQLGRFEAALQCFDQALSGDGQSADLYYWKGGAEQELKRYEEAIQSYRKAQQLNPERYQSLINYIKICQSRMG